MTRFIHIGLLCIQDDPVDRPTMEEVVDMLLVDSSVALPTLKVPAWMIEDDSDDPDDSNDLDYITSIHDDDDDSVALQHDYDFSAAGEFILELCPR